MFGEDDPGAPGLRLRQHVLRRRQQQQQRLVTHGSQTQTPLQEQRRNEIPPVPLVLRNVQTARFKEVDAESRPERFPHFSTLKPLALRQAPAEPGAPPRAWGGDSAGSAAGSSGACSASSSSLAPAAAPSNASTNVTFARGGDVPAGAIRVGVVYCGERTAPPVLPVNVVPGLFSYLSAVAPGSRILGFQDGPAGVLGRNCRVLTADEIWGSLNQGGAHLLRYGTCSEGGFSPSARAEEARQAAAVCTAERLDSLIVMAGPRDLSWAAALAVCFAAAECHTTIVGVPHSKSLSLYVPRFMPITLGFDSARRMLSEVAGNIVLDSLSSRKYWHFVRCGADPLTMEVALQTRCTFSVLTMEHRTSSSEGLQEESSSLMDVVDRVRDVVTRRREVGRASGVVLVTERLIETRPEMASLKRELVELLGSDAVSTSRRPTTKEVETQLKSEANRELFKRLPRVVQMSLIFCRDSNGVPLLPMGLEGERLLGRFVEQGLKGAQAKTEAVGHSTAPRFAPRFHVLDLMSNAPLPSPFDCAFGFLLGHTAGALAFERRTFYVATCTDMHLPVDYWEPSAVPFSFLYPTSVDEQVHALHCEREPENEVPRTGWMLRKNLVEVYRHFRDAWVECNAFKSPGPMQFGDGGEVGPQSERPFSLLAEYMTLDQLKQMIQPVTDLPPPLQVSVDPLVMRDIRVLENMSALEQRRQSYKPRLPKYLRSALRAQVEDITPQACGSSEEIAQSFPQTHPRQNGAAQIVPFSEDGEGAAVAGTSLQSLRPRRLRVGVVFSSNQVPGFHNVVAGLFDYVAQQQGSCELIGYLGGFDGLIKGRSVPIDKNMVDQYRNLGGQDMLCQFDDPASLGFKDHLKAVVATLRKHQLDGLVLVGNLAAQCDSAFIAEACAAEHLPTRVVGVPVSLDCNFPFVQQTVGFDTICRTLSAYIGNVGSLAQTAGDRWIFCRTMGDAWSHIAVECTLQTMPNLVLLSGSQLYGQSMSKIVSSCCDVILGRHEAGQDFGVVLVPMGFVMDISEMRFLFSEIMNIMANTHYETSWEAIPNIALKLKPPLSALFEAIPRDVQYEICFGSRDRQTHKIDLSVISTDRILLRFVEIELERRRKLGVFTADFFRGSCCPMVYQARSSQPTNLDCDLAYTLGWGAGALVSLGKSGQLIHAWGLHLSVDEWRLGGIPLTSLLSAEYDEDTQEQCIRPANVQLLKQRGIVRPFSRLPSPVDRTTMYHGPVQFYGAASCLPSLRTTWYMTNMPIQDPTEALREIARLCSELQSTVAQARNESTLYAVNSVLSNAISVLESYRNLSDTSSSTTRSLADVPIEQMPQVWRFKRAKNKSLNAN